MGAARRTASSSPPASTSPRPSPRAAGPPQSTSPRVLTDARGFNVAASMLEASGVTNDFEADERGAGITIFALLARGTSLHATSTAGVCTLNPFDEMPNHNGHNVGPVH